MYMRSTCIINEIPTLARANDSHSNFPIFEAFNNNLGRVEKCVIKSTFLCRIVYVCMFVRSLGGVRMFARGSGTGTNSLLDFMSHQNFMLKYQIQGNMIHVYIQAYNA